MCDVMLPDPRNLSFVLMFKGPSVASKGYGAGLTAKQAGEVVHVMPEVLALYYEDSLKPSIAYMYNKLAMFTGPDYLETTVATLRKILEGTSLSDTW